jgi:2-hydroxychromene-2-carboxylate isomerase
MCPVGGEDRCDGLPHYHSIAGRGCFRPELTEGTRIPHDRNADCGKPKLSPVVKGLLERGLMRLDTGERLPRLLFTETGLAALRAMMSDRRLADPKKFAHIRQELGIDPVPETEAAHD